MTSDRGKRKGFISTDGFQNAERRSGVKSLKGSYMSLVQRSNQGVAMVQDRGLHMTTFSTDSGWRG